MEKESQMEADLLQEMLLEDVIANLIRSAECIQSHHVVETN